MNSYDRAHRNLGSLEASQGNSGYDGPQLGHKRKDSGDQPKAQLEHEAFLRWLETEHPDRYTRVMAGDYVSNWIWECWISQWRVAQW